jgi:phage portal protein BeeE
MTAWALSGWMGEAFGGGLELRPDLDGIEALAGEREASRWKRASGRVDAAGQGDVPDAGRETGGGGVWGDRR